MKKYILFILLAASALRAAAQEDSLMKAGYLRFPTIPPFTLLKADSTSLTRDDLARHKKTIVMYFSPSCDHCKHQTKDLLDNMDKFKDVEILMASYQPMEEIQAFYNDFHLENYPNIKIGRDTKYFFVPFYKMNNLPFMALYNNKGKLLTTFEGTTKIDKLLEGFKGE
ncbi:MAG: redoxin domain-containing protein [Williamsia sp.]|nr:redoxin domain-containing protein [Williamsia sp.]